MSFNEMVQQRLIAQLTDLQGSGTSQLNDALRLLSKWRSALIQNTLLGKQGTKVSAGPFKGLDFLRGSSEGCHVAKLLGCYEQPLQPFIEEAAAAGYDTMLNIGCAEGYYAVGMALRMPTTRIFAFDTSEQAQGTCRALAEKNGVSDRIEVGALFKPGDFANHAGGRVLVVCDIEGAERELLDPHMIPALKHMDVIVEAHECFVPGIAKLLSERFAATHVVTLIEDSGFRRVDEAPAWFNSLSHLDQLLAVWEWRTGSTPWLVMKAKRA